MFVDYVTILALEHAFARDAIDDDDDEDGGDNDDTDDCY